MIRITPRYVDHLWYPIVVKDQEATRIGEMQGREINAWNDMVREQWDQDTKNHPRGWCI